MTASTNRKTVLVVEDDEGVLKNMLLCLEEALRKAELDVEVIQAISLRDALTAFEKHAPIAISTDLQYPIFSEQGSNIEQYAGIELLLNFSYDDKDFDIGTAILYTGCTQADVDIGLTEYRFKLKHVLQKRRDCGHTVWAEKMTEIIKTQLAKA